MVSDTKKKLVQELTQDIKDYPIVGVLNFENLPAQQLQNMRAMLRSKGVKMSMARKRLLRRALAEAKKDNVGELTKKITGMPALLFTKDNPFSLYKTIQKNKSKAPAKAGHTAPRDIVVPAGPTNFAPGPIISELAAVGIKTKVDGGKLTILEDTTVAKEGDEISPQLADTLKRLDIQPMEVGLDLVAAWENGTIFAAKQLHIDEAEYLQNISNAAQWAFNLAMEAAYFAPDTTELLLQKAFNDAKTLAREQDILTDATVGDVLAKAEQQALSLQGTAGIEASAEKPAGSPEAVEATPAPESEEKAPEEPTPEVKEEAPETTEEPSEPETQTPETAEQAPTPEEPQEEAPALGPKEDPQESPEESKAAEAPEKHSEEPAPQETPEPEVPAAEPVAEKDTPEVKEESSAPESPVEPTPDTPEEPKEEETPEPKEATPAPESEEKAPEEPTPEPKEEAPETPEPAEPTPDTTEETPEPEENEEIPTPDAAPEVKEETPIPETPEPIPEPEEEAPTPETPAESAPVPEEEPQETSEESKDEEKLAEEPDSQETPELADEQTSAPEETPKPDIPESPTESQENQEKPVEAVLPESQVPIPDSLANMTVAQATMEEPEPMQDPLPEPSPTKAPEPTQSASSDLPSATSLVRETMEKFGQAPKTSIPDVSAEKLVDEANKIAEEQKAREPQKDKSVEQTEKLFEQLKKQGTLRK